MKLVVVGGVAGGMSAAARFRRLNEDAEIIVLERGGEVSFANCGLPYYVSGEIQDRAKLLVETPESLERVLNIDVRVHNEAIGLDAANKTLKVRNAEGAYELAYDALILSPGAKAIRPDIPGIQSPRVTTLRTVSDAIQLGDAVGTAKRAVVLGAGFIGLEAAEGLAMRGVKTSIVELAPHVLPPLENEMAQLVRDELVRHDIDVYDGLSADAIELGNSADTVVLSDGTRIEADIIVLSVGVRPDTAIWQEAGIECERGAIVVDEYGQTNLDGVYAAGDATVSVDKVTGARRPVALAGPANRNGRLLADVISGRRTRRIAPTAGTSIVRVGELTAAMTGANRRSLDEAGIDYDTVHLHPQDHAGYFPGATAIHLLVHFGKDGKILGAQAVGEKGVDKRIDVIATALKGDMTVEDLIDLDLSYSPPYGSAKDPVNMAGMMALNVLDGTHKTWQATQIDDMMESALLLDVRSSEEFASGHLSGAMNIRHYELRHRLDEVREAANGRLVAVHCQSGPRSYQAHRVMAQAGIESVNLSGGLLTFRAALGDKADDYIVS